MLGYFVVHWGFFNLLCLNRGKLLIKTSTVRTEVGEQLNIFVCLRLAPGVSLPVRSQLMRQMPTQVQV